MKEIDSYFSQLMQALKDRKYQVISEIDEHFKKQIQLMSSEEDKWVEK